MRKGVKENANAQRVCNKTDQTNNYGTYGDQL